MKTRNELAVIAANLSDDVRSVQCTFSSKASIKGAQLYTYKAPTAIAAKLSRGDLVMVEGPKDGDIRVVCVDHVDDECMLDDTSIHYKWLFGVVDTAALESVKQWEDGLVDTLYHAQRRRAKRAMMQEMGVDMIDVPRLSTTPESDDVIDGTDT